MKLVCRKQKSKMFRESPPDFSWRGKGRTMERRKKTRKQGKMEENTYEKESEGRRKGSR